MDHVKTAEILANLLDTRFGIGGIRFGFGGIIDLFPGFGDILAACLSFYIVWVAIKMEVKPEVIAKMIRNVLVIFLVGSIPVIGDLIYILAKVNMRNMRLLKDNLPKPVIEGEIVLH